MRPRRFEREIDGLPVSLEHHDWQGCTFKDCEILVSEGDFSLVNCKFDACRLSLSGKAQAVARVVELFSQGGPPKFIEK